MCPVHLTEETELRKATSLRELRALAAWWQTLDFKPNVSPPVPHCSWYRTTEKNCGKIYVA